MSEYLSRWCSNSSSSASTIPEDGCINTMTPSDKKIADSKATTLSVGTVQKLLQKICGIEEQSLPNSKAPDDNMNYESILEACGGFGRHQLVMLLWYQLVIWLLCPSLLFMIFAGYAPPCATLSAAKANATENLTSHLINVLSTANSTTFLGFANETNSTTQALACTENDTSFMYSIVIQYKFVGRDAKERPKFIIFCQMLGVLLGPIFAGIASDHFGRKKTFIAGFSGAMLSGLAASFSPNWPVFTALRFVNGFFIGGVISVHYVIMMEVLTAKRRALVYIGGWPLAYILTGLLGYFTRDWRIFSIVINSFAIIPLLLTVFWLFESPKWLLEKGRIDDALDVMQKIAIRNRIQRDHAAKQIQSYTRLMQQAAKSHEQEAKKYHYHHLFRNREAALHTSVMLFSFYCVSNITYCILFNIGNLFGDPTVNIMLFGLMRLPISLAIPYMDKRFLWFGRRLVHRIGLSGAIACLIAIVLVVALDRDGGKGLACLVVSLVGFCFATMIWIAVEMYTAEIFPTAIRTMGNAACNVSARIASLTAPLLMLLGDLAWAPLPYVLLAAISAVNLVLAFVFLPETKGKPLPDMQKKRERCKSCDLSVNL